LLLLVALLFTASVVYLYVATRTPFWYDEVLTIATTGNGSPRAIWSSLMVGADSNPPLFYIVESWSSRLFEDPHIGYRFPSMVGFWIAAIAMFVFARSRIGDVAAWCTAACLLVTPLWREYTLNARPYTMVVGCIALALVAWQRADRRYAALSMGFLLVLAASLHFYAIYAIPAFALGEVVRTSRLRIWRPLVWGSFVVAGVPVALCWPLLARAREVYSAHFWAQPRIIDFPRLYVSVLGVPGGVILAFLLVFVLAFPLVSRGKSSNADSRVAPSHTAEECVLAIVLLAMPVMGIMISRFTKGGMAPRYSLPALLGAVIAVGQLAAYLKGRSRAVAPVILIATACVLHSVDLWKVKGQNRATIDNPATILAQMLRDSGVTGIPVVVSSGLEYLPIAYYRPASGESILTVVDRVKAVRYQRTDSLDIGLPLLATYMPLYVQQFSRFSRDHDHFMMLTI
jgi:4-amino-4-deoxy-L-arabinose transferase-like glycosyltransferase